MSANDKSKKNENDIEFDTGYVDPWVGVPLREAKLPEGVLLGAIVRKDQVIIPRGDSVVRAGDLVILFASTASVKKVEKLFSVKLEFF